MAEDVLREALEEGAHLGDSQEEVALQEEVFLGEDLDIEIQALHLDFIIDPCTVAGGPRYYGNGCGCGGGITTILILFILLLFLDFPSGCVILGCAPGCTPGQSSEIYTQTEYTSSTKREPLEGVVNKTDWYEDQLGWISSENVLIEGLEDFINKREFSHMFYL